jgi:hypothetical protein
MKEPRPERDGAEDECENQDKTFNTFRLPPPSSPLRRPRLPHLAPQPLADARRSPRLRNLAQRIHCLGDRPLFELFAELAAGADLFDTLERYARLDPFIVAALGGDLLPPPARLVRPPAYGEVGDDDGGLPQIDDVILVDGGRS